MFDVSNQTHRRRHRAPVLRGQGIDNRRGHRIDDRPFPEISHFVRHAGLLLRQAGDDLRQSPPCRQACRRMRPIAVFHVPGRGVAQPGLARKQGGHLGKVKADRGIGGSAVEAAVMFGARRHHQHIRRQHVERPMGHAFAGVKQHADHQPVVGRNALGPHADRKRTDAERKVPDADMAERAAESPRPSCVTSTWDPWIAWCRPSKLSRLQVLIWIDRPIVGHPCC